MTSFSPLGAQNGNRLAQKFRKRGRAIFAAASFCNDSKKQLLICDTTRDNNEKMSG